MTRKIYCIECKNRMKPSDENPQICHICYKFKTKKLELSGNQTIDKFIKYTQYNNTRPYVKKMVYVSYDKFENIKLIAEGGFSKIYKAIWTGGRKKRRQVVLKKLNNSTNITSKELNEVSTMFIH